MNSPGHLAADPDDPNQQRLLNLIQQALEPASSTNSKTNTSHYQLLHSTLVDKFLLHSDFANENFFTLALAMQLDPNLKILMMETLPESSLATQYQPGINALSFLLGKATARERLWFAEEPKPRTEMDSSLTHSMHRPVASREKSVQSLLDNNEFNHPLLERWNGNQKPYFFVDARYIYRCISQQSPQTIHSLASSHFANRYACGQIFSHLQRFKYQQKRTGLAFSPDSPKRPRQKNCLIIWWPFDVFHSRRNSRYLYKLVQASVSRGVKQLYIIAHPNSSVAEVKTRSKLISKINSANPQLEVTDLSNWTQFFYSEFAEFSLYPLAQFLHSKHKALHIGLPSPILENLALMGMNVGYAAPPTWQSPHPFSKFGYDSIPLHGDSVASLFNKNNFYQLCDWLESRLEELSS